MTIQLIKKGEVILFDSEDWHLVARHRWRIEPKKKYVRAAIHQKKPLSQINVSMHRLIMGIHGIPELEVDHKNRNPLDNRKDNLRIATKSQNQTNRGLRKIRKDPTGYIGVYYSYTSKNPAIAKKRIIAKLKVDRKTIPLGYFQSEKEAAKAYNEAALKYHGEFAKQNEL